MKIVTNLPPGLLSADRPHNYIFWSVSVIVGCTFGEGPGDDGRRDAVNAAVELDTMCPWQQRWLLIGPHGRDLSVGKEKLVGCCCWA